MGTETVATPPKPPTGIDLDPIEVMDVPIYHQYHGTSSKALTPFLHAIKRGELLAHVSSVTGKVLFPPLGSCPESGSATTIAVLIKDKGTIISFTTVHLPIPGSKLVPPFTVANILLDGSDQHFSHLVSGCDLASVAIGMRVKAVWRPQQEWDHRVENIEYFEPTGEPLMDIEKIREERLAEAEKRLAAIQAGEFSGGSFDA